MNYADIGTVLFFLWWGGCWLAYWLARRTGSNRDTRLIPMLFGITIATFYVAMHGRSGHWHHWWYLWNMVPNATLLLVAYFAPEARDRRSLMVLSVAGLCVDLTYFWFAFSGHRLPGVWYFCTAATIETLQVLCMVYFSGPFEPMSTRMLHYVTRKFPWTHQPRLLHRA